MFFYVMNKGYIFNLYLTFGNFTALKYKNS